MKNGEVIEKYGKKWVVLDTEFKTADGRNGILLLAADVWEYLPFDDVNSNYYPETSIYYPETTICSYLKEETKSLIGDEETGTVELLMTAENTIGLENEPYKTNGLFLLTTELYRKYKRFIPRMSYWWWTATAYSGDAYHVWFVHTNGLLDYILAYRGDIGVVPALVIFRR